MHDIFSSERLGIPIVEAYSSIRVNGMARRLGMIPGFSLDLTTNDPDDSKPWDFNSKGKGPRP